MLETGSWNLGTGNQDPNSSLPVPFVTLCAVCPLSRVWYGDLCPFCHFSWIGFLDMISHSRRTLCIHN